MPRRQGDEARRSLGAVVAVLAPVYFVMSGMAVDIPGLRAGDVAAFVLILVVACAGKFLGAYAGARLARIPRRDAAAIGVLMNTRGLIEIVLLTVGRDQGLIDDRLFTLFALMAITTTLLTSPALRRLPRGAGRERDVASAEHEHAVARTAHPAGPPGIL
jgi:Kef-type K+ transport system membrane component KefB